MSWTVSAVDPNTAQAEISGLWQRNLPEASRARFDWLYGARGQSRSWLLRDPEAGPIGSAGLMPRRMQLGDTVVDAGSAIDLNVDSGYRSVGPALALQRAATEPLRCGRLAFVYALPSPSAVPVLRRAGYREVGTFRRWAKPLQTGLRWQARLGNATAGAALGWCSDRWLQWSSAEIAQSWPHGFRAIVCRAHDARFDRLWERRPRAEWIMGERTAAYLDWRYTQYPDLPQETLGVVSQDDELCSYAVVGETDGVGYVSDLWFADSTALRLILAALIRHARRQRWLSLSISLLAPPVVTSALHAFGFRARSDARPLLVMPGNELTDAQRALLFNPAHWYVTRADSDTDV
jgi:hypothetical protein